MVVFPVVASRQHLRMGELVEAVVLDAAGPGAGVCMVARCCSPRRDLDDQVDGGIKSATGTLHAQMRS